MADPRILAALLQQGYSPNVQFDPSATVPVGPPPQARGPMVFAPAQVPTDGRVVGPGPSPTWHPAPGSFLAGPRDEIAHSTPWDWLASAGAVTGALGDANALMALKTFANPAARYVNNGPLEQLSARAAINDRAAETAKDWASLPPHVIQDEFNLRGPDGRFTKFPKEITEQRGKAQARAAVEKNAATRPQGTYDENGEWQPPEGWTDLVNRID